jgi:hypothetical protein
MLFQVTMKLLSRTSSAREHSKEHIIKMQDIATDTIELQIKMFCK